MERLIKPSPSDRQNVEKMKNACTRLKKEKRKIKKEVARLERELEMARKKCEILRKRQSRLQAKKKTVMVSEIYKQRRAKKLSAERKESVIKFLCRDENSRILPRKKDTVTKNKNKKQRRVFTKPLTELHLQYNAEVQISHTFSYRQFVRYCPFYVTQAKASDRNTCSCLDHENVQLLSEKLLQKDLLEAASISQLLPSIVCSTDNKACMYRVCPKCCYLEIEVRTPEDETVTWHQLIRKPVSEGEKMYMNFVKEENRGTCTELVELVTRS